jgi:pilus assembly protein CpaF
VTSLPEALRHLALDPLVTDILVNNGREVWFERSGRLMRGPDLAHGSMESHLERVLSPLGRRLDRLSPIVDARLADGTRVSAIIPPISVNGTCVAFRLFRDHTHPLASFCDSARALDLVRRPMGNLLVTGATGSGKTSLLASVLHETAADERIVVIEDTHELPLRHHNAVRLEARPPSAEGRGAVDLDHLLRAALRLRPDRIVVGEVRGAEALTLVQSMNTGHVGSMSTVHSNSAADGLDRIDLLVSQMAPSWKADDIRRAVSVAIGTVVHLVKSSDGRRLIDHIAHVRHEHRRIVDVVHRRTKLTCA